MSNHNFLKTREEYLNFVLVWKKLSKQKELSAANHLVYTLLMGKDLKKAFSQVKNKTKLENNCSNKPYNTLYRLLLNLQKSSTSKYYYEGFFLAFEGLVPDYIFIRLIEHLKTVKLSSYQDFELFINTSHLTLLQVEDDMKSCNQTSNQNVLEHGLSVNHYYNLVLDELNGIKTKIHDHLPKLFKNQ